MDDTIGDLIRLLACHIGARMVRKVFSVPGKIPGTFRQKGDLSAVSFQNPLSAGRFLGLFQGICRHFQSATVVIALVK